MCEALLARQDRHDAVMHIHEHTDTSCGHEVAGSRMMKPGFTQFTIFMESSSKVQKRCLLVKSNKQLQILIYAFI